MIWDKLLTLLLVFVSGGILCLIAQLLIIKTKLTPARILVIFLVSGIFLELIGVFDFLYSIFKAGVSVPIVGFGSALAKGAIEFALKYGFVGAFAGGLVRTAYGVGVAVVASYLATLIFKPKTK
ncbi:MAG: SpoVA/SpoVAEb family sporulation membrane protein [Clostridia bacterium]|nr:SpoVA/SpoVAEb family sporulation membrane protein [Clostridia bacterium]